MVLLPLDEFLLDFSRIVLVSVDTQAHATTLVLTFLVRCTQYHDSVYSCSSRHDVCVAICNKQGCAHCNLCDIWVREIQHLFLLAITHFLPLDSLVGLMSRS